MRILHWAFPYQPSRGGQSIFIERLSLGLTRDGHSVGIMVSVDVDIEAAQMSLGRYVEIIPVQISVGDLRKENKSNFLRLAEAIVAFKPDIIHVHNLESQEIVYLRFFKNTLGKGIPIICTLHDFVSLKRLKKMLSDKYELNYYSAVVSPSNFFASHFDFLPPIAKNKFEMIYNGVPSIKSKNLKESKYPLILFAADLVEHKGGLILLSAWAKIFRKFPNTKLLVAGEGVVKEFLIQYARSSNFESQVEFTGWLSQSEIQEILTNDCIFVMPSMIEEAFGLIAAEAAMAGSAIIVNQIGALTEIVEDEISGLVVAPGDSHILMQALERLLFDKDLRSRLGRSAKKRAESYFILDKSIEEYEHLYEKVIQKSSLPLE